MQLRERMRNSKTMLLLVGEHTKYIRGYIPWEIEYARYLDLPIVVANLNGKREYDARRCPSALENGKGAVHISFEVKIVKYALAEWLSFYDRNKPGVLNEVYYYKNDTYRRLGL